MPRKTLDTSVTYRFLDGTTSVFKGKKCYRLSNSYRDAVAKVQAACELRNEPYSEKQHVLHPDVVEAIAYLNANTRKGTTNRDLITLVFTDFAINTLQIAEHFGVTPEKAYKACTALTPAVFSNGILDGGPNVGPVDNIPTNRRKYPVLWQSNKTYDDHELDEVLKDAADSGVDLDKVVL